MDGGLYTCPADLQGLFQLGAPGLGIVWNCWTGALAHLGVARANVLQARTSQGADADAARVRALAAYRKTPTPTFPSKAAKAEYAKMQ